MKKFFVLSLALCFTLDLTGCGGSSEKAGADTSLLMGAEAVSEDGTVFILLPDETFVTTDSSGSAMEFESEDEGFIYVIKGEDENVSAAIPASEDELLSVFENVDADFEVRDFVSDEDENGVQTFSATIIVSNFVSSEDTDPENFILLENITVDGETYYNAVAEITDEALIEKVAASLATFGDTEAE